MSESTRISQTGFRMGDIEYRGVSIQPGLLIDYEPEDTGDFLTPEEARELRDWLTERFPNDAEEDTDD